MDIAQAVSNTHVDRIAGVSSLRAFRIIRLTRALANRWVVASLIGYGWLQLVGLGIGWCWLVGLVGLVRSWLVMVGSLLAVFCLDRVPAAVTAGCSRSFASHGSAAVGFANPSPVTIG